MLFVAKHLQIQQIGNGTGALPPGWNGLIIVPRNRSPSKQVTYTTCQAGIFGKIRLLRYDDPLVDANLVKPDIKSIRYSVTKPTSSNSDIGQVIP
jgi:hypothetical protein